MKLIGEWIKALATYVGAYILRTIIGAAVVLVIYFLFQVFA